MPTFAAVDIGSNSVRLKIARLVKRKLQTLHEDREVLRLGASVFQNGAFDPPAMAQTLKVLQRFQKATRAHRCDQIRVVATSATRDATNGEALIEWIRSALGWPVEIITGLEEGRLIHFGLMNGTRLAANRLLMVDLGGGSCELTISDAGHIREMVSLPLGAVRLTQQFLAHDPPQQAELDRLRHYVSEELARIAPRIRQARVQLMVATSGTAAALAGGALGRKVEQKSAEATRAGVEKLARALSREKVAQRHARPGIGPKRAEIIVAGAVVYSELMARCGLEKYRYSPLGLRDGLLAQMAADFDSSTREGRQVAAERQDALRALGKRYDVDVQFAEQVRQVALDLFEGLRRVHGLPDEYEDWLEAAAMLHEVGAFVNRNGRHRHTRYLIANSELFGYSPAQRAVIAAIARFLGNSKPTPSSDPIRTLPPLERERVPRAVALLRLARALNLGRRGAVSRVRVRLQGEQARLLLSVARGGAELEVWAAERESLYFRQVLGRSLRLEIA